MNREVHVRFCESAGLRRPALLTYLKAYESVAEARPGIAAYFEFYNHQRLEVPAYRTPRQVSTKRATCQFGAGEKRWRVPNTLSTMRCKAGQDFLPYDRPIALSKIGATSGFLIHATLSAWRFDRHANLLSRDRLVG
jgi:hypothetical protein